MKTALLVLTVLGAVSVTVSGAGCASAPGGEESVGSTAESLSVADERERVRAACHGTYGNHGQCVSCVARQHTSLTGEFARGECKDRCVRTSCAIAGADCGTIDDGCGGTLTCGAECSPRKTFAVTCTQRSFGCTSPVGDVVTTSTLDVVVDVFPTIVPSTPVAAGTVLVSPTAPSFLPVSAAFPRSPTGTLEGISWPPAGAAGYLDHGSYAVDRTTMTFSSTFFRQSHGTCGPTKYTGIEKTCTGVLAP